MQYMVLIAVSSVTVYERQLISLKLMMTLQYQSVSLPE